MVVLYRKYRPQKLTDLVGQEHIKKPLLTALTSGKISHAYLFCGPKGTGKTTTARIIAKMLNCSARQNSKDGKFSEPCNKCDACMAISNGSYLDVLEIDAASNRLIDDVRDLREKVRLAPTFGRYKIYILDEVHMLTSEAFNALLKTLEEPPEHTIFILCTTAPGKLPQTIISRCQRFDFKRATETDIVSYLAHIAKQEKVEAEKEALTLIAKESSGGFRDAVSLFDQLVSGSSSNKLTEKDVKELITQSDEKSISEFVSLLGQKDLRELITFIKNREAQEGISWSAFLRSVLINLEQLLWQKIANEENESTFFIHDIKKLINLFLEAEKQTKFSIVPELPIELAVIEWCGEAIPPKAGERGNLSGIATSSLDKPGTPRNDNSTEPSNLSLEDFQRQWKEILKALKPYNHSVEALLKSCEASDFDGKNLTIAAFYKFHKDKLSDIKVKNLLEKVLQDLFNFPVKVSCLLKEKTKANVPDDLAKQAEEIFQ